MNLFVRSLNGTELFNSATVAELVDQLNTTLDQDQYYLTCGGVPLTEDSQLQENATIDMQMRLHGGKVHGSLARAGKVRNQTPKVEKNTEGAKKKLTGRSKRRSQYTKRFVNVVVTPGRKRGPNSNAK